MIREKCNPFVFANVVHITLWHKQTNYVRWKLLSWCGFAVNSLAGQISVVQHAGPARDWRERRGTGQSCGLWAQKKRLCVEASRWMSWGGGLQTDSGQTLRRRGAPSLRISFSAGEVSRPWRAESGMTDRSWRTSPEDQMVPRTWRGLSPSSLTFSLWFNVSLSVFMFDV